MIKVSQGVSDIIELIFPSICVACENRLISQEKYVCFSCWHDLPKTTFHKDKENKVAQLFWGRVEIENASAFFSYKKGSKYQQLLHYTKYKGLKELGFEMGRKYGFTLLEEPAFKNIDCLVPVPLHPRKYKQRGYNQSEWIAEGIAHVLNKPLVTDNLYRKVYTSTQTRKNRFERWKNVDGIFDIHKPEAFTGKHILLIDDVVTTGATLEACAIHLLKLQNTKVSIATMAYADI